MESKTANSEHLVSPRQKRALTLLLLLLFARVASAHLMYDWSYKEMFDKADLVVIATPSSNTDTTERTTLPGDLPVIGMSTTFSTLLVLKGDKQLKGFALHHYKLAETRKAILNGPAFVAFQVTNPRPYLLFLIREADGRYAPATDQIDPGAFSIIELHGASR